MPDELVSLAGGHRATAPESHLPMKSPAYFTILFVLSAGLVACTDGGTDPTPLAPSQSGPALNSLAPANDPITDLESHFGPAFSLDTTQLGLSAPLRQDNSTAPREFCRDHFKPVDMFFEGGHGLMRFHLDPPLLFVSYRPGTFTNRGMVFRKAVYETISSSEATDGEGNVWRFRGRFNVLCLGGAREIGPIVIGGQVLVSQNPIDLPVLVRRASRDDCEESRGSVYRADYSPYSNGARRNDAESCDDDGNGSGEGTQYEPGDNTGGETVNWGDGTGTGKPSDCGARAVVEYICLDVYNEVTGDWEEWTCGYATTC